MKKSYNIYSKSVDECLYFISIASNRGKAKSIAFKNLIDLDIDEKFINLKAIRYKEIDSIFRNSRTRFFNLNEYDDLNDLENEKIIEFSKNREKVFFLK